jgi:hypothetical protein
LFDSVNILQRQPVSYISGQGLATGTGDALEKELPVPRLPPAFSPQQ